MRQSGGWASPNGWRKPLLNVLVTRSQGKSAVLTLISWSPAHEEDKSKGAIGTLRMSRSVANQVGASCNTDRRISDLWPGVPGRVVDLTRPKYCPLQVDGVMTI